MLLQTLEQKLSADTEQLYSDFNSKLNTILVPPGDTGYSAQVLTSVVALFVDYESRFAALVPIAQSVGPQNSASQRLSALLQDLRQKLKEWSYLAAFKVTYERFDAYIAALPTAVPPGTSLQVLTANLNRLVEFEQSFHSFEPRAAELAAQGMLPWMQEKWLTPLAQITQKHIAAMNKRCDDERASSFLSAQTAAVPKPPATPTGQDVINEFNRIRTEIETAIRPIQAQIDVANQQLMSDPSPLYTSMYNLFQNALQRTAPLEGQAQDLAAQGQPQWLQPIQAWRNDKQNASGIIRQILSSEQANKMGMLKIGAGMQSDWQKHHDEIYRIQQGITGIINKHRP